VRRIAWIVGIVGMVVVMAFGASAQGVPDDEHAPVLGARAFATVMAERLAERQSSWPSGRTRELFRTYRQWLAYLGRTGLEAEFAGEVRDRSRRMAEIIAARFEELVEECRAGNPSVLPQMRDLATWSALYPALVQGLGPGWSARAENEIRRCGIPDWYGIASAGQADAFSTGYYGSVEVTWRLDEVDADGLEASYRADVTYSSFVIPRGECEVYTIDSVVPNLQGSYLSVDFGLTPHVYRGAVTLDVAFTVTDPCDRESRPFRMTAPFPIMLQIDDWALVSPAGDEIDGAYEDAATEYQSRWNFTAVERD
jgi:hypothetical protein